MANKAIKILCGQTEGYFFPARFGPAGRSLCIKLQKSDTSWMTPVEFEKVAGKGSRHNWKRTVKSITHDNKVMNVLLDEGIIKACQDPKTCQCSPCKLSRTNGGPLKVPEKTPKSSASSEKHHQRDTDSDSGISVEITNTSASTLDLTSSKVSNEPLSTAEQDQVQPNYTLIVQEAIFALTSSPKETGDNNGCSLLGITLYVLKQYPMLASDVQVTHNKIKTCLNLLKRMGLIKSINDENDELEMESTFPQQQQDQIKTETSAVASASRKTSSKTEAKETKQKKGKFGPPASKIKKKIVAKKNGLKAGKENSTASNKPTFNFANAKPKKLSPALSTLLGGTKQMGRHEAVRGIWLYIKKNKLQDPNQKAVIICDEKLKAVTKKKRVTCSEVLTCLSQHMTPL